MKAILLLLALQASTQATSKGAPTAAQLFNDGLTFAQFLDRAVAQRDAWLANAARLPAQQDVDRLRRVRDGLRMLIVAEDWCPDSVHTVPYIANLARAADVDLRIVDRTIGASVMASHRTRDGRPVTPVVVLLRHDRDVGAWVERPAPLQQLFFSMATDPESARQFAQRGSWYDADRGRTTLAELLRLAEDTMARH